MPRLLIRWIAVSLTIWMLPSLVSGIFVQGLGTAIAAAAIVGVLNLIVRPLFILLTLPLTVFTFGFFILVINALLFQFASHFVSGFAVNSFSSAFFGALIVSIVSWVMNLSIDRSSGHTRVILHKQGNSKVIDLNSRDGKKWE